MNTRNDLFPRSCLFRPPARLFTVPFPDSSPQASSRPRRCKRASSLIPFALSLLRSDCLKMKLAWQEIDIFPVDLISESAQVLYSRNPYTFLRFRTCRFFACSQRPIHASCIFYRPFQAAGRNLSTFRNQLSLGSNPINCQSPFHRHWRPDQLISNFASCQSCKESTVSGCRSLRMTLQRTEKFVQEGALAGSFHIIPNKS